MKKAVFLIINILFIHGLFAQSTIKEESIVLDTYGFSNPNPVPILADNPKIYPYYKFEEYEQFSKKKEWKVITLENDYIKVMILPEIGGKIWGAIEKSTGEEFLYKNEVVKFRNIAMRGPWTSGGIEFNFGIIGHHPSTATPVDFLTKKNNDGSVSCFVGNTDLPSNTQWRVEIRLEEDKAYFETNVSWYNASALNQSYYNWMTGAAKASQDLEFFIPGNISLAHSGNVEEWPVDNQNRELSFYKNNDFGPDKSYHIVGAYKDFFGGYYHDTNFGFGQWAPYEEMPGQKLWLWSQARSGGIWEDLLTDTDGQYIEFQAGRLFNQYFPSEVNPISQANFEPYVMDRWREIWFPFKEIGGMEAVSEYGVLNVEKTEKGIYIGLNALQKIEDELVVLADGKVVFSKNIHLDPMALFVKELSIDDFEEVEVILGNKKLYYSSNKEKVLLKRPFVDDEKGTVSVTQKLYQEGWEALKYREFDKAFDKLNTLIKIEPSHINGLIKLADLEYRRTNYNKALSYVNTVLKKDTYNYEANYFAGLIYIKKKDFINALESLGWAARSMEFRSVSYAKMAEIYFLLREEGKAMDYAEKALSFNKYNLNAMYVKLLVHRKGKDKNNFKKLAEDILSIDGLNQFVVIEREFMLNTEAVMVELKNEFPEETILNIAIKYITLGNEEDAKYLLESIKHWTKAKIWLAYLTRDTEPSKSDVYLKEIIDADPNFVFPYRQETASILEWAIERNQNWKLRYYLAQNYIAVGKIDEGKNLLKKSDFKPEYDVFYRFRAKMLTDVTFDARLKDYQKAVSLNKTSWKLYDEFIQFYLSNNKFNLAYRLSKDSYKKFPKSNNIGLNYAKALLKVGQYTKSIKILKELNILPFEHASESKEIYTKAHVLKAFGKMKEKKYKESVELLDTSKTWPENLGVGKPYDPDVRLQDFLLYKSHKELGNKNKSDSYLKKIVAYNIETDNLKGRYHLFTFLAGAKLGTIKSEDVFIQKLVAANTNWGNLAISLLTQNQELKQKLKEKRFLSAEEWELMEAVMKF